MNVRGAGVRSLLTAIEQLHGAKTLETIKAALPAGIREQIDAGILPVQWYSVDVPAQLHVAVKATIGGGKWTQSHRLGVAAARIDFTGLYRVLVRTVQYDSIWDRAERAWSQYNSHGDARWMDRTESSVYGVIRNVSGYNMGLWQSVAGRMEGLLQMAGVKAVTAEVLEGTANAARIEVIWVP